MLQRSIEAIAGNVADEACIGDIRVELHNQVVLAVDYHVVGLAKGCAVVQVHHQVVVMVYLKVVVRETGDAQSGASVAVGLDVDAQVSAVNRIFEEMVEWRLAVGHEQRVGDLHIGGRHLVKDVAYEDGRVAIAGPAGKKD